MHDVWERFGLTSAPGTLLNALQPGEPTAMSLLARRLRCHDSNVTGLVDRLQARGLVERREASHDRRLKLIALTEKGTRTREQLRRRLHDPPSFVATLSPADQQLLLGLLRRARP